MRFLITGGTGLIGQAICQQLLLAEHKITVFSRQHSAKVKSLCGDVNVIHSLDDYTPDKQFHVIINLAGEPIIDKPWTAARKTVLLDSRVQLTERLVSKVLQADTPPKLFLSGSAVGYYGHQDKAVDDINQKLSIKSDFASDLCSRWEKATTPLKYSEIRTIILRTGIVLSRDGGMLKKMQTPFKLGAGGRMGDGQQMLSWIHLDDYVRAIQHFINNIDVDNGEKDNPLVYNLTAPNPVSNADFSLALAHAYGWQKLYMNIPTAAVKLLFGQRASMLLEGQAALPARLQSERFRFIFNDIEAALTDIIKGY